MAEPIPPFTLDADEQLVMFRPASSLRGITLTTGRVWLTTKRLYFQPIVLWVFWLAPVVGLIFWLMGKSHRRDLPLGLITGHHRAKFGRNPNVLKLVAREHGEFGYIVDDFVPFATALSHVPAFTSKALTA